MLLRVLLYELRYRFTRPQTYIYFLLITAGAFLVINQQAGAFGASDFGKRLLNGPFHVMEGALVFSLLGVLITAGYLGQAIFKDYDSGMYPLLFTTPVSKGAYLGGRFFGALTANAFIMTGWGVGILLGSLMPWLDAARFGPFLPMAYVEPFFVIIFPNLLFTGAIFFALAALTRQMLPNYVGGITLLIGYLLAQELVTDLDNRMLAALVDPFGLQAFDQLTKYWTVAEQNTQLVGLSGFLLWNRLLWTAVGLAIFGACFAAFRFQHAPEGRRRRKAAVQEDTAARPTAIRRLALPAVTLSFTPGDRLRQYGSLTANAFTGIVRNKYFGAILGAGLIYLIGAAFFMDELYGTTVHPVTGRVIAYLGGEFSLFLLIIITFYAGELVWRERDLKIQQITDALPVQNWVAFLSKLTALALVVAVLLAVIMVFGMATQTVRGYFHYEVGVYVQTLFGVQLIDWLLICVLALFVQAAVNHKYLGHFVMVGYYLLLSFAAEMGLEDNLLIFGGDPGSAYSDMNGFGHFLGPYFAFKLYWGAAALLLALASNLLWVRGQETAVAKRLGLARQRLGGPAYAGLAVGVLAFAGTGGFIFHNTHTVNDFQTAKAAEAEQAEYERLYKRYEALPLPRLVALRSDVDLRPETRDVYATATFTLVNKEAVPIDSLPFSVPTDVDIRAATFSRPATRTFLDERLGFAVWALGAPLAPGDTLEVTFDVALVTEGFTNETGGTSVVGNGTFINNFSLFPGLGYSEGAELSDDNTRRAHGLEPKARMAAIDDSLARMNHYLGLPADWIRFETTVSTSPDQIALAPGTLLREWTEDGRRHFHYSTGETPVHAFFSYLSADYEVATDVWTNGAQTVDVEVYHHAAHPYNVERFIEATKAALSYYTEHFGPYQFEQARIVEFPRYASFAQAFPGTMPYSESVGFIAKVDTADADAVDYPFFVAAHEVAHQWWAHQVVGGNVQGSTLLSEGLSEYSALMVLRQRYGPTQMRRFLKEELDGYLAGRANESKKEMPLLFVENQPYIHYRKGAHVLYALSDYIGEARLNAAIRAFRDAAAYQARPYPTARDLYDHLRAATPDSLHYVLEDAFEHITLYENRATAATATPLGDGRYTVTLDVSARKVRADSLGAETEIPMHDWIDVGVFADDDLREPLYLQKHRLASGTHQLTVTVDGTPRQAGLDPHNKLIDRQSDDNSVRVSME